MDTYSSVSKVLLADIRALRWKAARERAGIEAVCFDKDNTITAPYSASLHEPFREAFEECQQVFGLGRVAILSNSAGSSDDAPAFRAASCLEENLGIPVIRHGSKVPL